VQAVHSGRHDPRDVDDLVIYRYKSTCTMNSSMNSTHAAQKAPEQFGQVATIRCSGSDLSIIADSNVGFGQPSRAHLSLLESGDVSISTEIGEIILGQV